MCHCTKFLRHMGDVDKCGIFVTIVPFLETSSCSRSFASFSSLFSSSSPWDSSLSALRSFAHREQKPIFPSDSFFSDLVSSLPEAASNSSTKPVHRPRRRTCHRIDRRRDKSSHLCYDSSSTGFQTTRGWRACSLEIWRFACLLHFC